MKHNKAEFSQATCLSLKWLNSSSLTVCTRWIFINYTCYTLVLEIRSGKVNCVSCDEAQHNMIVQFGLQSEQRSQSSGLCFSCCQWGSIFSRIVFTGNVLISAQWLILHLQSEYLRWLDTTSLSRCRYPPDIIFLTTKR